MKRILIVDDEEDIREVARVSLQLVGGWEVLTAPSGSAGVAEAERNRPDAILLDVMMPEMDGPATLAQLQANPATRGIPVMFLTAKVQQSDRQRFAGLGVAGVLSKPFDPMQLPAQVDEILRSLPSAAR
jgi:CheY-like chemotaxis protein